MTKENIALVVSVVALVIAGLLYMGGVTPTTTLGSATACTDGYTCFTNLEIQGASLTDGDSTVSGGTLNITTANTATSTAIAGCVQTYATSTATPVKLLLYASTSIIASASFGGGTQQGFTTWGYGLCPNL